MSDTAPASPPEPPEGIAPSLPAEALPDFSQLNRELALTLERLLKAWADKIGPIDQMILDQLSDLIAHGDITGLATLVADFAGLTSWLGGSFQELAERSARLAQAEARRQGIDLPVGSPASLALTDIALVSASTLGAGRVMSVVREAMRLWPTGRVTPVQRDRIMTGVRDHLASLTTAQPEYVIGGGLIASIREGRMSTAQGQPSAALYGNEILDSRICANCELVHGKWIGNLDDPNRPWMLTYPVRGYVDCLGRDRCRGQIVYVWRGGTDWRKWVEKEPLRS